MTASFTKLEKVFIVLVHLYKDKYKQHEMEYNMYMTVITQLKNILLKTRPVTK